MRHSANVELERRLTSHPREERARINGLNSSLDLTVSTNIPLFKFEDEFNVSILASTMLCEIETFPEVYSRSLLTVENAAAAIEEFILIAANCEAKLMHINNKRAQHSIKQIYRRMETQTT
ncbi:DNA-directed RNA polymerase subunit beta [Trichinella pseudospiralis]